MERTYEDSKPIGKAKWLTDRRKRIELFPARCFNRVGTFSKYIWKTEA